jgi:phage shock protein A
MGKMFDNFRVFWNDVSDKLSDPGKLAQLSVSDLEKGISKAKGAAAPVIGSPVIMLKKLDDLKRTDEELTNKITTLIKASDEGKIAAVKYIERQVDVRANISSMQVDYDEAREAAKMWQDKIRLLENELFNRRQAANNLEAKYATAKAEQQLGKTMKNVDSLTGSTSFSSLESRVEKEQAKAAGYSQLSGLTDRVNEEKILKDIETNALLEKYLNNGN